MYEAINLRPSMHPHYILAHSCGYISQQYCQTGLSFKSYDKALVRVIIAQFFHTLFATSGDDALGQIFYVWVLHTNYHQGSKKLANLKKVRILFYLLFNDQGSGFIFAREIAQV